MYRLRPVVSVNLTVQATTCWSNCQRQCYAHLEAVDKTQKDCLPHRLLPETVFLHSGVSCSSTSEHVSTTDYVAGVCSYLFHDWPNGRLQARMKMVGNMNDHQEVEAIFVAHQFRKLGQ